MARTRIPLLKPRIPTTSTRIAPPSFGLGPRAPKVADAFYSSAGWIALRDQVRRESRNMCEWPGCQHRGRWIDHKAERKDRPDLALDRSNLWNLCSHHHGVKTADERRRRDDRGGGPKNPQGGA